VVSLREVGVGMQRVPVAAEGADHEAALLDRVEQRLLLGLVAEQHVRVAVAVTGVVAGAELDGLDAERSDAVEHLLDRKICEESGKDAELHPAIVFHSPSESCMSRRWLASRSRACSAKAVTRSAASTTPRRGPTGETGFPREASGAMRRGA